MTTDTTHRPDLEEVADPELSGMLLLIALMAVFSVLVALVI